MKKLSLLFLGFTLLILQSCIVSSSPKMGFFDNPYHDYSAAKFTSVNVPMFLAKPIVKKALREEPDSEALIALVKKISDIKVMTVENGNPQMLGDLTKYLTRNNFTEWMSVKKETETIDFRAKQNGDTIRKLLITVKSGNELVFVDVSGRFTADDISEIINYSQKKDVKKLVSN